MLTKKPSKPFISLAPPREKMDKIDAPTMASEGQPPHGPMVYIHDVELPFSSADTGTSGTATIKYKLHEVKHTERTPGKIKKSYDLEISHIQFGAA